MPAYFDSGFCVREPSWHHLETLLQEYPESFEEARKIAGRLWEPETVTPYHLVVVGGDLVAPCGCPLTVIRDEGHQEGCEHPEYAFVANGAGRDTLLVADPEHALIRRDDTNVVLGQASADYTPVTNADEEVLISALLDLPNVKIETMGVIRGGRETFTLVLLDEPFEVAGDDTEHLPFLAILNSHTGEGAFKALPTSVRVVCWNTYNAASMMGDRSGRQFVFRHSGKVADRIEEAKDAIAGLRQESEEWRTLAAELYALPVREDQVKSFTWSFIPEPPADVISPRVRDNIDRARETFHKLYMESPTTEAHRGTGLGLVDASVEYLDHVRGYRNSDTYLGRTLLRPEPLKAKAVNLVRELVG